MTTIPTRLARAAAVSTNSAHQRKRVLDLYREWIRGVRLLSHFFNLSHIFAQAPDICTLYSLDVPPSAVRAVIRQRFEKNRYVSDPKLVDILIHKSRQEYQEAVNFWKQEPHVLGPFLTNRERPHRTFLQKFFEGVLFICVADWRSSVDTSWVVVVLIASIFRERRRRCASCITPQCIISFPFV
jgi:NADH dehydrogenase (ubiquinone) 1 alpha subcomplex subunit 6